MLLGDNSVLKGFRMFKFDGKEHLKALVFGVCFSIVGTALVYGVGYIWGEENDKIRFSEYRARIHDNSQVYDGDTISDVRVVIYLFDDVSGEVWPGIHIYENRIEVETDIRIAGIDTPEKRPSTKNFDGTKRSEESRIREKQAALLARDELIHLLDDSDYRFTILNPKLGKYAGENSS